MNALVPVYVVGSATVMGGLKVRAISLVSDLVAGPGEVVTTIEGTVEAFRITQVQLASGEPCYL